MNYKLKAAPTAVSKEQNSQKEPKANRIALGVDAHLKSYQAARKIDKGAVGVAQTFRSKAALLLYLEKQREQSKESGGALRSRAAGLDAVSRVKGKGYRVPGLCPAQRGAEAQAAQEQRNRCAELNQ